MEETPRPAPFIGVVSDTHSYYDDALETARRRRAHRPRRRRRHHRRARPPAALAPVTPVMGNTDLPFWADELPWEAEVEVLGLRILVCHIGQSLMGRHDPVAEGFDLVISGHSHKAAVEWREETLFLNPGAAGKARFGGPRTLALVDVGADGRPVPEIVSLD